MPRVCDEVQSLGTLWGVVPFHPMAQALRPEGRPRSRLATYRLHGLTIASSLELPGVPVADGDADVILRYGSVPDRLSAADHRSAVLETAGRLALLRIPGVGRFLVDDGRQVVVDAELAASPADVQTFVLGSALTLLCHQRGGLVLHASGAVKDGRAVLFAGHSGRGKSTLCAAMAGRGWSLLTDDAAVVTVDRQCPRVHRGPEYLKLWPDAVSRLGRAVDELSRVRPAVDKYRVPLRATLPPDSAVLEAVFILDAAASPHVAVKRLTGAAAFEAVIHQTRMRLALEAVGGQSANFLVAACVAEHAKVFTVRRPHGSETVDEVTAKVEAALRE